MFYFTPSENLDGENILHRHCVKVSANLAASLARSLAAAAGLTGWPSDPFRALRGEEEEGEGEEVSEESTKCDVVVVVVVLAGDEFGFREGNLLNQTKLA